MVQRMSLTPILTDVTMRLISTKIHLITISTKFPPNSTRSFCRFVAEDRNAHQRSHPVDIDRPSSEYMMMSDNQNDMRPPAYRRYHSKDKRSSGCCCRCMCCFCCFLFLLIVVLGVLSLYFFTTYSPKIPSYNVDSFTTNAFDMAQDFSLYTEFLVTVKAVNPNEHISFVYGKGSSVEVVYVDSSLCKGEIPAFEQGHKNTTMIPILLKGKSEFGSGLQAALMANRHTGRIPLIVKVKVPVVIVIGNFPLNELKIMVDCALVVDNLSMQKKANILSNVCVPTVVL